MLTFMLALAISFPPGLPPTFKEARECGCTFGGVCRCKDNCQCGDVKPLTYAQGFYVAIKTNQRLAVFVGIPARAIPGVVTVSVPHEGVFKDFTRGSVVVSEPRQGKLIYLGEVHPDTPDGEIRAGGQRAAPVYAPSFNPVYAPTFAPSRASC